MIWHLTLLRIHFWGKDNCKVWMTKQTLSNHCQLSSQTYYNVDNRSIFHIRKRLGQKRGLDCLGIIHTNGKSFDLVLVDFCNLHKSISSWIFLDFPNQNLELFAKTPFWSKMTLGANSTPGLRKLRVNWETQSLFTNKLKRPLIS